MEKDLVEKIHGLLFSSLVLGSPVLSGNMKSMIRTGMIGENAREIVIDAPYYDLKKWRKTGVIVHTGQSFNGQTAYAESVNKYGAFGRHNKSEGWVDRTILDVVQAIANEVGAEVIYEI